MTAHAPIGVCRTGRPQCELSTVTASQLSAAIILFFYVVIRVYRISSAADADPLAIQVTIASAATILYIFLCFWLVEDKLIIVLRELRPGFEWGEFSFRVILLIVLALMPTFVQEWIPNVINDGQLKTTGADYVAAYLALLYLMFLIWDGLIWFGAPRTEQRSEVRDIARSYYRSDLLGFILLSAVEATRFFNVALASVLLIAFILFSARQVVAVGKEMWESHFAGGLRRRLLR